MFKNVSFCLQNVLMHRVSDGEALNKYTTTRSDATAATMQSNVWSGTRISLWHFDTNSTSVCVSGTVK